MSKKHLPLPRNIAKETVLEVLHNHGLLIRTIWSHSTTSPPNQDQVKQQLSSKLFPMAMFKSHVPTSTVASPFYRSYSSFLTRWMVTETATEGQEKKKKSETTGYALEEEHIIRNAPLTKCVSDLFGAYNPLTDSLMALLKGVSAKEKFVNMAGGGLSYYDNGKFKHD